MIVPSRWVSLRSFSKQWVDPRVFGSGTGRSNTEQKSRRNDWKLALSFPAEARQVARKASRAGDMVITLPSGRRPCLGRVAEGCDECCEWASGNWGTGGYSRLPYLPHFRNLNQCTEHSSENMNPRVGPWHLLEAVLTRAGPQPLQPTPFRGKQRHF